MSWIAPWALAAAGLVALAVIAAHLVSWRRPREVVLPTARFVPAEQPPAAARTRALSDVLLLVARLLLVALVGLAAAGPVLSATAGSVRRIVIADASVAVADTRALRDSALAWTREGDVLLVADTVVRVGARAALGTGGVRPDSVAPATGLDLTAVLLAAQRAAARVHGGTDSLELVLVGAIGAAFTDAATDSARAAWPGRVTLVELPARATVDTARVTALADADDPLAITMDAIAGVTVRSAPVDAAPAAPGEVRVVRSTPSPADSTWARAGGTLVHWPRAAAARALAMRAAPDSAGALSAGGHVVLAPFARVRRAPAGRAVAHWVDGEPAATERPLGDGCVRTVAVEIADAGDLVLRPAFERVVRQLVRPCGAARGMPVSATQLAALRREGPLAAASAFENAAGARSTLAPWLWGAALLLALALTAWETVLAPRRARDPLPVRDDAAPGRERAA